MALRGAPEVPKWSPRMPKWSHQALQMATPRSQKRPAAEGVALVIHCINLLSNGMHLLISAITRLIIGSIVIDYLWHDCYGLFVARTLLLVSFGTNPIVGQLWHESYCWSACATSLIVAQKRHESYWPASQPASRPARRWSKNDKKHRWVVNIERKY